MLEMLQSLELLVTSYYIIEKLYVYELVLLVIYINVIAIFIATAITIAIDNKARYRLFVLQR